MSGQAAGRLYPPREGSGRADLSDTGAAGGRVVGRVFRGIVLRGRAGRHRGLQRAARGRGRRDPLSHLRRAARHRSGADVGRDVAPAGLDPASAIRHGVVLVPADRVGASVAMGLSVAENIMLNDAPLHLGPSARRRARDVRQRWSGSRHKPVRAGEGRPGQLGDGRAYGRGEVSSAWFPDTRPARPAQESTSRRRARSSRTWWV